MRQIDHMTPQEIEVLALKGMTAPRTSGERNKAQNKAIAKDAAETGLATLRAEDMPTEAQRRKWADDYRKAQGSATKLVKAVNTVTDEQWQSIKANLDPCYITEPAPNKAQHSPLPWTWNEMATIVATNDTPVASVLHRDWQRGPEPKEAEANAKLIVRAVNHADKLAEALREILAMNHGLDGTREVNKANRELAAYEKDSQ